MNYTYDDFLRAQQASGLFFSDYDMDLASRNPDVGMGILAAKQQWQNAQTDEERRAANAAAEQLRASNGSYYGGPDGSEYNPFGGQGVQTSFPVDDTPIQYTQGTATYQPEIPAYQNTAQAPTYQNPNAGRAEDYFAQQAAIPAYQNQTQAPTYQNPYAGEIADLYGQQKGQPAFQYDVPAPTWQNSQQGLMDELAERQRNYRPFENTGTAPTYQDSYGGQIADAIQGLRDTPAYQAPTAPAPYQNSYADEIAGIYGDLRNYGDFQSGTVRPEYASRYDGQIQDALQNLVNRPGFSYDVETDPLYSAYRKQYLREGQRATADALGAASAASAGLPSSYAVTAATQTGDRYSAALTDKIPELYQAAYDRYLREFSLDQSKLSALQGAEREDYQRYRDALSQYNTDRNFEYNVYQGNYDRLRNDLSAARMLQQDEYGRYLDALSQYNTDRNFNYGVYRDDYDRRLQELGLLQGERQNEYGRYLDALGQYNTDRNFNYGVYQDEYGRLLDAQGIARQAQQDEYGRYIDALSQYNRDRDFAFNLDREQYARLQDTQDRARQMEQDEYARYLDSLSQYNRDRDFDYGAYMDAYDMARQNTNTAMDLDDAAYQRYLGELAQYNKDREFEYGQYIDRYNMEQDAINAQQRAEELAYERELEARQYQDALAQDEWNQRYKMAQLAAEAGDLSYLRELGVDTSNYYTVNPISTGRSSGGGGGGSRSSVSEAEGGVLEQMLAAGSDVRAFDILASQGYSATVFERMAKLYEQYKNGYGETELPTVNENGDSKTVQDSQNRAAQSEKVAYYTPIILERYNTYEERKNKINNLVENGVISIDEGVAILQNIMGA